MDDGIRPYRKEGISGYAVSNELVLHDEQQAQVFALNVSARIVWERCDGHTTLDEISEALSRDMNHPLDDVRAGVQAVVDVLLKQRLLVLKDTAEEQPDAPPQADTHTVRIAFEAHQVVVTSDDAALADQVTHLFREMCTSTPGSVVGRLTVQRQENGYYVDGTRDTHVRDGSFTETLRCLKYEVVLHLIEARPDLIWLHAGAAAGQGGAVLLIGDWGCGKSTLVTALYQKGWRYLSDDVIPFDPATGCVLPFPLTPTVRDVQESAMPQDHLAGSPKHWVDLAPGTLCESPTPVQALVFPQYDPAIPARLQRFTPGSTVVAMIKQALNFEPHQGQAIRHLCALAERAPAYHLAYNDSSQATLAMLETLDMRKNN